MGFQRNGLLPTLPGVVICLLGVLSQLFIGRRLRIPKLLNYGFALLLLLAFFGVGEQLIESLARALGPYYRDLTTGMAALCCVALIASAAMLLLRDQVPSFNSERRQFLRVSTAAACAAPIGVLGAGIITRKDFRINELEIKFPNLPKDLQGLRLLQLSDIHIGAFFTASDLARVVDASNQLRADLAFITGDLITTKYDPLDRCLLELRRLRSTSGIWGCMGNHELYSKVQAYTAAKARELDMRFLRREAESLRFGQSRINLVGVDFERRAPYLEGIEELVARDQFNLLLSHTPEVFPVAAKKGFDLTLSGHTHGGQINLELLGTNLNVVDLHMPYTKGLYTLPKSAVYVNSGLGTIGIPVRIGAPPEITLIRLCSS